MLRETARPKLNLTLEVLGRRADSYHQLQSLVAFAGLGDVLEFEPGALLDLAVEGPFAAGLSGDNLVMLAAMRAKALVPSLELGRFNLSKNLPVAAGLGGGSADAAAALRLIARHNDDTLSAEAMRNIAIGLGSDVAVCLGGQAAVIGGRGEEVRPIADFPVCGVILANPGVELRTTDVYLALEAPAFSGSTGEAAVPEFEARFQRLVEYLTPLRNDLTAAAISLAPQIVDVLAALGRLEGARIVRLSGSGPTCFALFASREEAERGAEILATAQPGWWVAASVLQ